MTLVTVEITAAANNGFDDGTTFNTPAVEFTTDYVDVGKTFGIVRQGWFRFENVAVPPGKYIHSAVCDLDPVWSEDSNPVVANWYGNAADNAGVVGDHAAFAALARTNLAVQAMPGGTGGAELMGIIQEIINRSGWASGNSLALILDGSPAEDGSLVHIGAYGGLAGNAASLTITYADTPPDQPVIARIMHHLKQQGIA